VSAIATYLERLPPLFRAMEMASKML
jgi:hypothetical protein